MPKIVWIMIPAFLVVAVLMFGMGASITPRVTETVRVTQLVTVRETITITQALPTQTVFTGKMLMVRLGEGFTVTMDKQPIEVKCIRLHFENKGKYGMPASGHRYAVIDLEFRNQGTVEARTDWWGYYAYDMALKVSTGYSYKLKGLESEFYNLSIKPGTAAAGYVCFEIPSEANPIEMYVNSGEWTALLQIVVKLGSM